MTDDDVDADVDQEGQADLLPSGDIQANSQEYVEALEAEIEYIEDVIEDLDQFDDDEPPSEEWADEYESTTSPLYQWRQETGVY